LKRVRVRCGSACGWEGTWHPPALTKVLRAAVRKRGEALERARERDREREREKKKKKTEKKKKKKKKKKDRGRKIERSSE
jgi:hypothetical protein